MYLCPQGQDLRLVGVDEGNERSTYRGRASVCNACPIKEHCATNRQGRVLSCSFHAVSLDRVRRSWPVRCLPGVPSWCSDRRPRLPPRPLLSQTAPLPIGFFTRLVSS